MTIYASPTALNQFKMDMLTLQNNIRLLVKQAEDNLVVSSQSTATSINTLWATYNTEIAALSQTTGSDWQTVD